MNSYEVANWLNNECTDEEFLEVFTYLNMMRTGRKINKEDIDTNKKALLHTESIAKHIGKILEEIISNNYFGE